MDTRHRRSCQRRSSEACPRSLDGPLRMIAVIVRTGYHLGTMRLVRSLAWPAVGKVCSVQQSRNLRTLWPSSRELDLLEEERDSKWLQPVGPCRRPVDSDEQSMLG
jgi:hypothetical protein